MHTSCHQIIKLFLQSWWGAPVKRYDCKRGRMNEGVGWLIKPQQIMWDKMSTGNITQCPI